MVKQLRNMRRFAHNIKKKKLEYGVDQTIEKFIYFSMCNDTKIRKISGRCLSWCLKILIHK